jgi:hypothetical protein
MAETLNTHENGNCANRVLATVPFENDDFYDDDFDEYDNDNDDDYYERQQEELQERAMNCTCGAWKLGKSGEVYHVADCCCGAE